MIITPGQLNRRAELYRQLGSMIAAGTPLIKALELAGGNRALRSSQTTILALVRHLQAGLTFAESMKRVHGWMPEFDVALLAVGEESGKLDGSFKLLAEYYATRAKVIRDTIAGLVVTVATLHVFFLVFPLNLWIQFAQGLLFGNYSQCIPFLLQKAVVFGSAYAGVLLFLYAGQGRRGEPWRALVESVLGWVPILRTARRDLALARLAGALEASTSAGVPIVKGWEMAAAASASPRLRREVSRWKSSLEGGTTPAELVNQSRSFPEMFASLYHTGEISGQTDDALHHLQSFYQEEGFRALRLFTRIMNGTIYGLVALMVAYQVIHFYLGYFGQAFQF